MELSKMVTQDMSKDSYLRHFPQFSVDVKRCSETKIENSFVIMEPKDEDLTALQYTNERYGIGVGPAAE
ncbi:putative U5 small nuclear ribonucleoprotein 200 kDa helicase [Drosophila madeirensis]|uniref:U5 small nuclear ribonucleoprotein 200 kDa helicase n=1 Tax=Drosophila madeirensis TaxID=30013 RepID=A0AAU9FPP0_DROMD